ncbi:MAG: site-2 protease family protein [Candidatus Staskawiczbacteria bacterium]
MFTALTITIFSLIVLLFSVMIHELAHGYVAYSLGDPTAKYEGRLTLNPLKHLDVFGSIILPLVLFITGSQFLFGWAKPVPVNPYNFRDQKWGGVKVAIAGPLSNFGIAIVFGLLIRLFYLLPVQVGPQIIPLIELLSFVVYMNILLGIFNLIPIPPLDGSWILFKFLPASVEKVKMFFQQYGFIILIFVLFSGALDGMYFFINLLFYFITGTYFLGFN